MPPRVPGYTLAEVLRAFHTQRWAVYICGPMDTVLPQ